MKKQDVSVDLVAALKKVAPTCMAIDEIAHGFITSITDSGGVITPKVLIEVAQAEDSLKKLKVSPVALQEGLSLPQQLESIEKSMIENAMQLHRKKGDAAIALGIPQSTLSTKLLKYGLRG